MGLDGGLAGRFAFGFAGDDEEAAAPSARVGLGVDEVSSRPSKRRSTGTNLDDDDAAGARSNRACMYARCADGGAVRIRPTANDSTLPGLSARTPKPKEIAVHPSQIQVQRARFPVYRLDSEGPRSRWGGMSNARPDRAYGECRSRHRPTGGRQPIDAHVWRPRLRGPLVSCAGLLGHPPSLDSSDAARDTTDRQCRPRETPGPPRSPLIFLSKFSGPTKPGLRRLVGRDPWDLPR